MQSEIEQFKINSINFVRGDFQFEFGALHMHMMAKIQIVLVPFFAFPSTYSVNKATHNMLALMLDLHFKSLDVMKACIRREKI